MNEDFDAKLEAVCQQLAVTEETSGDELQRRWMTVCSILLDWSDIVMDLVLSLVRSQLEGWPEDFVRTAPESWRISWEQGTLDPRIEVLVPMLGASPLLPAAGGGSCPVQYDIQYEGREYYLRYRWGGFSITLERDGDEYLDRDVYDRELETESQNGGEWTDEESNVILNLVSQAIRDNDFENLKIPGYEDLRKHPYYKKGIYPLYVLGDYREKKGTVSACNLSMADSLEEDPLVHAFLKNSDAD